MASANLDKVAIAVSHFDFYALSRKAPCFKRSEAMHLTRHFQLCVLLCCAARIFLPLPGAAQTSPAPGASQPRNGQHDFDWDIGAWKTHQKRLLHPLTGSTTWVEYNGTDVVQKLWDGGNMGRIQAEGPAGRLEIFTVRLYNPDSHQWSIYFTNSGSANLSQPVIGEFKDGRGEFYDQEPYNGRVILVRFSVSDITPNSCRFEQAFSADGGKTWEVNFVVTETLMKTKDEASLPPQPR